MKYAEKLSRDKLTATRLNSGVNYLFPTFAIVRPPTPKSLSSASVKVRDDQGGSSAALTTKSRVTRFFAALV